MLSSSLAGFVPPQTPALVIDMARLDANIAAMQAACDAAGVRLRVHGKMHKCPAIAARQIAAGAVGLCCQTVGEAQAFVRAGTRDMLVSAPLPRWAAARLAALARESGAALAAVVDSPDQIAVLNQAAGDAGVTLGAVVDVDIGMHRVGAHPDDVAALAAAIVAAPALHYGGIQAYFGHLQHLDEGRSEANAAATATLAALVSSLRNAGLAPPQVTGGGTGTYRYDLAGGVFTELQCGSYALMDAEYGDCGGPDGDWPFAPALFLAATCVSTRHKSHVTIDAGLKAMSADVAPAVIAGAAPGSVYRSMGDEHGAIIHPATPPGRKVAEMDADPALPWPADAPREGDLLWLQPGHCDPTINLYDAFWAIDADGQAERWAIAARRTTP
jgi:3-hydroxy-D-aspartate aldolase